MTQWISSPNNSKKSKKAKGKNKQASKSGVKDPDVSGEGSAGGSIGIPPVGQADDALDNEMDEVSPYTFISRKEIVSVQESDPVLIECRRLAEVRGKWKTANGVGGTSTMGWRGNCRL